MMKRYSAIYMSVCLHLVVGIAVFFFMPLALDAPIKSPHIPSISIEFITDESESIAPLPVQVVQEPVMAAADHSLVIEETIPPAVALDQKIIRDTVQLVEASRNQTDNNEFDKKIHDDFRESKFVLQGGEIVSMADWIVGGITKNQIDADATNFERRMFLGQVARSMMEARPMPDTNPLAGDGQSATPPVKVEGLVSRHAMSLIRPPAARRKELTNPGGMYAQMTAGEAHSTGPGLIHYEANISNCAHEEARTGINRCNEFDRWVSQKVVEYLKAKGE